MTDVIDFTQTQSHLTITASDSVHVLPLSLIKDVINGRKESNMLTEPVIQVILKDWLLTIEP